MAAQHGLDRGRAVRQIGVAVPDKLVDHSGQAEPLAVFRGEDPDPGRGQPRGLVRDDDPAAASSPGTQIAGPALDGLRYVGVPSLCYWRVRLASGPPGREFRCPGIVGRSPAGRW